MAREVDPYNIGSSNEDLQRALMALRQDFDSHIHDGTISRAFQNLFVESISSLGSLSVRKRNFNDNNAGFWVGIDSNLAKLFLGSATNFLKWNGTSLTITGSITATTGTIGGWTIGATSLTAGSGSNTVGLDSGGSNPAFYAGSATPGSAPFRVTQAGALTASNATITGTITSTSGTIGGFTIGLTTISGGSSLTLSSAGTGTITGGTIQTASSGARVEMNGANSDFRIYDATQLVATIFATSSSLWLSHEISSGNISFATNDALAATIDQSGNLALAKSGADFIAPNDGTFGFLSGVFFDRPTSTEIRCLGADLSVGTSGKRLGVEGYKQPVMYHGYVNSGGTSGTPFPSGWSVANTATGRYTVTHNLGTTNYVVTAIATDVAAVKYCSIESRNSNTFVVRIADVTPTLENNAFTFVLFQT